MTLGVPERGARLLRALAGATPLPFAKPRGEALVLVLVALVALSPVYITNEQDVSHVCLAKALLHGELANASCFTLTLDRSRYDGALYSNKAPGMSALEALPVAALGLPSPTHWALKGDLRLWAVRLFACGLPFLLCIFLVGRVSEGLVAGSGAASAVALGLGTLLAPLAATGFDHVPAAALGFLAFALAWGRRPLVAGAAAGLALTMEYEAAWILVVLLGYTALQGGRAGLRFLAGTLPGVVLLGAYDWAAFGAPWHNPLRYSDNIYKGQENSGLLGINLPSLHATRLVFVGDRGLLITSPLLLAATAGLIVLWRRGLRAEVAVCGFVAGGFLIAECGYFIPYGGGSPGPRFFTPALPFLLLGFGSALSLRPRLTAALTAVSIVATTAVTMSWTLMPVYRETVWGEIVRIFGDGGSAPLIGEMTRDALAWGPNRLYAGVAVSGCAVLAFVLAFRPDRREKRQRS